MHKKIFGFFAVSVLAVLWLAAGLQAAAVIDDAGQKLDFPAPPVKVVSLLPSATEIICALGAESSLAGVTYHDSHLPGIAGRPIVGGAFTPKFNLINDLAPDLLIVAPRDFEKAKAGRGSNKYPILVWSDGVSLAESETRIAWLGAIFNRPAEAEAIVHRNNGLMKTVADKVAKIPESKRKRVMRLLLGRGGLMTPGQDFFQTEIIEAAGGLPPKMGQGSFVPVSLDDWRKFDPEVVFACGPGQDDLKQFLNQDGWREASAVKNGLIYNFPCALTCRAATNTGVFAAWLASMVYTDDFADQSQLVHPQERLSERPISLDLPYVAKASIVDSRIMDFVHRTLLIDFKNPQNIISSDSGERGGIMTVGNSFSPTPTWSLYHKGGFEKSRADLLGVLKMEPNKAEFMFTGADLNNLSIKTASFRDMKVTALVTAGVEGNALRAARDVGNWYEPGTINILIMTNHHLSSQAAARALITITEAKTAALWDMDIRSVQSPLENPATGTGTDSIIVVSGEGSTLRGSGGHSKMGQLISEAVYAGVQEALLKQNGKIPVRHVFERLAERGLSPHSLTGGPDCPCQDDGNAFQAGLEDLLLTPRYRGFLEAAFSLSDARGMGQLANLDSFEAWGLQVASEIAGEPVKKIEEIVGRGDLPPVLRKALNALGTGLKYRDFPDGNEVEGQ